jgi:uncharacterized peroxidase-related enzyme
MKAHMELYLSVMFSGSGLSREERELVAVVVSAGNSCPYCVNHHARALDAYWRDEERTSAFARDHDSVQLPARARALVEYASKLTGSPANVIEDDVQGLRDAGLNDSDILNLNLVVSYFNFVNRVAMGLGVDFSDDEVAGYRY